MHTNIFLIVFLTILVFLAPTAKAKERKRQYKVTLGDCRSQRWGPQVYKFHREIWCKELGEESPDCIRTWSTMSDLSTPK